MKTICGRGGAAREGPLLATSTRFRGLLGQTVSHSLFGVNARGHKSVSPGPAAAQRQYLSSSRASLAARVFGYFWTISRRSSPTFGRMRSFM